MVGYSPWGRKESDTTERLHFIVSMGQKSRRGSAELSAEEVK